MAVAEKVGIDRRGNPVYKRRPDGEVILEYAVRGPAHQRPRRRAGDPRPRRVKAIDDDLPEIAKAYEAFRKEYPEPGLQAMITRIEAHNYRCFPKLAIDLDRYHVLAGANGAGKTTLLDVPVLIGDMLRRQRIVAAFLERHGERIARPGRPPSPTCCTRGDGDSIAFAFEARLPP